MCFSVCMQGQGLMEVWDYRSLGTEIAGGGEQANMGASARASTTESRASPLLMTFTTPSPASYLPHSMLSLLYNLWSSICVTQILLDVEPAMGHGQHTTALMLGVAILDSVTLRVSESHGGLATWWLQDTVLGSDTALAKRRRYTYRVALGSAVPFPAWHRCSPEWLLQAWLSCLLIS